MTECPKCRATLVAASSDPDPDPDPGPFPQVDYVEFVPVAQVVRTESIPWVRSILDSGDLRYYVDSEHGQRLTTPGATFGFNPMVGAPTVLVHPDDVDAAHHVNRSTHGLG